MLVELFIVDLIIAIRVRKQCKSDQFWIGHLYASIFKASCVLAEL